MYDYNNGYRDDASRDGSGTTGGGGTRPPSYAASGLYKDEYDATDPADHQVPSSPLTGRPRVPPKPPSRTSSVPANRVAGRRQQRNNFLRQDSAKYDYGNDLQAEHSLSPAPGAPPLSHPELQGGYLREYTPREDDKPAYVLRDDEDSDVFPPPYSPTGQYNQGGVQSPPGSNGDYNSQNEYQRSNISSQETVQNTIDRSTLSSGYPENPGYRNNDGYNTDRGYSDNLPLSPISHANNQSMNSVRDRSMNQSILSGTNRGRMDPNQSVMTMASHVTLRSNNADFSGHSAVAPPAIANRSILSQRSILSHHNQLDTAPSRDYSHYNGNLSREYTRLNSEHLFEKTPTYKQNGVAHPVSDAANLNYSTQSIDTIRRSMSRPPRLLRFTGTKGFGMHNFLVNLSIMCIMAAILAVVGLQLLFRLRTLEANGIPTGSTSLLSGNGAYGSVQEVCVALASLVFVLNLSCLLVCGLHAYLATKLIRSNQGEEKALEYLRDCAATRYISICGFFLSLPVLILAVTLYLVMEYQMTSAIIGIIVLMLGLVFIGVAIGHTSYLWHRAKDGSDKKDSSIVPRWKNNDIILNQSELSTLV